MKVEMTFSNDIISHIHKLCQEFIEDNYSAEIIYFNEIWELYKPELKKWLNKPPKKWRFRLSKPKRVKYLSMADSAQPIELTTPKVIEVISASFFRVAGFGEHISLEKIEEIINTYGKKLSSELGLKIINYFAPLILEDLEKMKLVPTPIKEVKKEIEMDSRLEPKRDEFPPKVVEEKKDYWIYSHEKPSKPHPASKEEVEKLEKVKDFSRGRKEATQLKKLLYLFLSNVGGFVEFEEINDVVWGDQLQKSPAIHQLKDRLIKFTGGTIKPFIMSGTSLIGKDDQDDRKSDRYYIKETYRGKKFKYCMILWKDSVKHDEC
jgi:hypothetical protein